MKMQLIQRAIIDFTDDLKKVAAKTGTPLQAKFVANNKKTLWRYQTLYTKEPATITWLQGLDEGDVLWDVGANIGLYSLFAALVRGARVVAFEPGAANYWIMNENIRVNNLQDLVQALCVALSDKTTFDALHMHSTDAGQALNQTKQAVDDHGRAFKAQFRQAIFLVKADDMVERFGIAPPTAIKVDVDGAELDVLAGASNVMASPGLKKVSLELNSHDEKTVRDATAIMTQHGFSLIGSHSSPLAGGTEIQNFHFMRS